MNAPAPPPVGSDQFARSDDPEFPETIDLLAIVATFVAEWRTGLIIASGVFLLGCAFVLHLPSQYEAGALLLPRDPGPASNSLASLFTGGRSTSPYMTLLVSRTLRDDVIRRADLLTYFHMTSMEAARARLLGMTKTLQGGDGTIGLVVRDQNANSAAKIANAYIDALRSVQESMAITQSDLQRHFFEQQLQREKDALAGAEQDLEKTQEGSGIVQVETQTQIGLGAIAGTRLQITALQVRLAALLQSETEQNPEVRTLRSQIAQLGVQERALESGSGSTATGAAPAAGRMPGVNLAYARKEREVKYHEALVNSLAEHYEQTRLAQANIGDTFDVIDRALVPESPTWPPRRMFLLLLLAASLFAGLVGIALRLLARRVMGDSIQREHLRSMRRSLTGGR